MVNLFFRFLILRNREYNGDLSFAHLDIQGRSYDETKALTLGPFSRNLCRVAQMRVINYAAAELLNSLNSQQYLVIVFHTETLSLRVFPFEVYTLYV